MPAAKAIRASTATGSIECPAHRVGQPAKEEDRLAVGGIRGDGAAVLAVAVLAIVVYSVL